MPERLRRGLEAIGVFITKRNDPSLSIIEHLMQCTLDFNRGFASRPDKGYSPFAIQEGVIYWRDFVLGPLVKGLTPYSKTFQGGKVWEIRKNREQLNLR